MTIKRPEETPIDWDMLSRLSRPRIIPPTSSAEISALARGGDIDIRVPPNIQTPKPNITLPRLPAHPPAPPLDIPLNLPSTTVPQDFPKFNAPLHALKSISPSSKTSRYLPECFSQKPTDIKPEDHQEAFNAIRRRVFGPWIAPDRPILTDFDREFQAQFETFSKRLDFHATQITRDATSLDVFHSLPWFNIGKPRISNRVEILEERQFEPLSLPPTRLGLGGRNRDASFPSLPPDNRPLHRLDEWDFSLQPYYGRKVELGKKFYLELQSLLLNANRHSRAGEFGPDPLRSIFCMQPGFDQRRLNLQLERLWDLRETLLSAMQQSRRIEPYEEDTVFASSEPEVDAENVETTAADDPKSEEVGQPPSDAAPTGQYAFGLAKLFDIAIGHSGYHGMSNSNRLTRVAANATGGLVREVERMERHESRPIHTGSSPIFDFVGCKTYKIEGARVLNKVGFLVLTGLFNNPEETQKHGAWISQQAGGAPVTAIYNHLPPNWGVKNLPKTADF